MNIVRNGQTSQKEDSVPYCILRASVNILMISSAPSSIFSLGLMYLLISGFLCSLISFLTGHFEHISFPKMQGRSLGVSSESNGGFVSSFNTLYTLSQRIIIVNSARLKGTNKCH